ncbi:hypothetical protein [Actinospongicola halichondriae]|uniref:hypothetical protein n=1 Tax=Actinospongicola halichondriae TaxID=3236844 RepID=UPI003D534551
MASPTTTSPVERLRSLTDTTVTLVTFDGEVTGTIVSCCRSSVWLIGADDLDVVVPLDEIMRIGGGQTRQ